MAQQSRPATQRSYPSLRGKNAIVTGGGRGLGRVMALALAEQGANVLITGARAAEELAATEEEIRALGGGRSVCSLADVSDRSACEQVVREAEAAFGTVDILVNNAARGPVEQLDEAGRRALIERGISTMPKTQQAGERAGRFWESDVDGYIRMLMTNVAGPFLMTRACVPGMIVRGFGRIINISVSRATMIRVGGGPYGPLKAALEASTRVWAAELDGTGVTVNALLPGGPADTAAIPGADVGMRAAAFKAGEGPRGQEGIATGLLPPAIMAPPLLWLASEESSKVTGRRFVAKDWNDDLEPAEAASNSEADRIEWPHVM